MLLRFLDISTVYFYLVENFFEKNRILQHIYLFGGVAKPESIRVRIISLITAVILEEVPAPHVHYEVRDTKSGKGYPDNVVAPSQENVDYLVNSFNEYLG